MAKFNQESNSQVTRQSAERLQLKLYQAAESALDLALVDQNIPAALLSSVQSILRDASLQPDLSTAQETEEPQLTEETSKWIDCLEEDLGLD